MQKTSENRPFLHVERGWLQNPLADFSQDGFEVARAADGNSNDAAGGWAVSPVTGVIHWATFETKEAVGTPGGTVLTFKLHHKYAGNVYQLGRFRLSVTREPKPGLSLAEDFRAVLANAPEVRSEAQKSLELSIQQAATRRLTAAQNIAWALINSPAFLFNH